MPDARSTKAMRLPTRALVLLVLSALLPLLIFSATMGARDLQQQHDAMKSRAGDATKRVADLVNREVTAVVDTLTVLAQSPDLDEDGDLGKFQTMLLRTKALMPILTKISLRAPGGLVLAVASCSDRDVPDPALGRANGTPYDDNESFEEAIRTKQPTLGHMTTMEEGVVFAVRIPVVKDGIVRYVVSGLLSPRPIRTLLLSTGLPKGWIGIVIDGSGRVVARSAADDDRIGKMATDEALAARRSAPDGFYEARDATNSQDMMISYHVIPDTRWSVHVAIPKGLYKVPFIQSVWLIGAAMTLSIALAVVILLLLGREMRLRRETENRVEDGKRLETLGRITGGVAHDFNNILTIFMGSADTLKRRKADPAKVEVIADMMLAAAKRGQGLTSQLLAYARRSAYEPVTFCLQDRIADLTMIMERATRPDIVTVIRFDDAWPLLSDPIALENAIINLAVNAKDAMPQGGHLSITARNVSLIGVRDHGTGLKGDFVVISVQDTGSGIPDEILDRVFDPFFTTKGNGKGTGLGLSQVYGFARQSGGEVRVVTKAGRGTRFDIYLPRSLEAPVRRPSESGNDDVADEGRLLVVEDNPDVARLVQEMMTASGYEVVYANSAEMALEIVSGPEHFDAMLSDIMMDGGMSGLDAAPLIQEKRPGLPIVLMTGYSEALARGSSRGFPVVCKPFQRAEVVKAIIGAKGRKMREVALAAEAERADGDRATEAAAA